MTKKPEEMTIKEFMEWYANEYDGAIRPETYTFNRRFLQGFIIGYDPDNSDLASCANLLADACNFFEIVKRYTK